MALRYRREQIPPFLFLPHNTCPRTTWHGGLPDLLEKSIPLFVKSQDFFLLP